MFIVKSVFLKVNYSMIYYNHIQYSIYLNCCYFTYFYSNLFFYLIY